MKLKASISLVIILVISCRNSEQEKGTQNPTYLPSGSILIQPIMGIDNINFFEEYNVASFHYRNLNFTIDSGQRVADATNGAYFQDWIQLDNEATGLSFTFSTPYNTNPALIHSALKTLKQIKIYKNKLAHFDNGITIGKSTYNDVVNAFGQLPKDWQNEGFIDYQDKGVSFSFDTMHILQEVVLNKIPS